MSQDSPNRPREAEPQPGYVPASPTRRIAAWVGVIYMVIILALTTYALATGELLGGLTGLMAAPACGGLAAVCWVRRREGRSGPGGLVVLVAAALLCAINLFWGILSLTLQFGG